MTRKPAVAGMFYPRDFKELEESIKQCFLHKLGPESLPKKERKGKITGAIIPHAGYIYSGPAAAHAYKAIAEAEFPDVFILIGPNHTGMGYNSILFEDMETPFGIVNVDLEFAKRLENLTPLVNDSLAHLKEHSLEVHLPFLQFIAGDKLKKLKIVSIIVDDYMEDLGLKIKQVAKEQNKTICVIASSDFIHHGVNFGYFPFQSNAKENIMKTDKEAYSFIKNKDTEGFLKFVNKTGATICGVYPIAILMDTIDLKNMKILSHYTSAEISGDNLNCVDYMSVVIRC